jgi:peroxiredoxin
LATIAASPWIVAAQPARADAGTVEKTPGTPPKIGDTAPDFELKDLKGASIKLSSMVEKGPVVLVQLRGYPGYQCPFCTLQVGQLLQKSEKFAAAKASVLLVYPGPAEGLKAHAEEFVRGKDVPANFYLLLDPDYKFVNLYGLRWDAPHETAYPSTFVLNQKREVLFAQISHSHGDRSKVDEVLAALPK